MSKLAVLIFLLSGSACTKATAPYTHVILPVVNNFQAQERALRERVRTDSQSFQGTAALAALLTVEAKQTGDSDLYDQAEKWAKKSLAIFPIYNDRAHLVLADLAQARHEFKRSIQICRTLLQDARVKRGAKLEALSLLITSELATGELNDAFASADQLVNMDSSIAGLILRALVLEALGRDDEVLADYKTAFQKETFGNLSESAKLRIFLGRFYYHRGDYPKAKVLWNEAYRILPSDIQSLGLIAELALQQGDYQEAIRDFQAAFSVSKQSVYLLGEIRAKRGARRYSEADDLQKQVQNLLRHSLSSAQVSGRYAHRNELVQLLLLKGGQNQVKEAIQLANEEILNRRNSETLFLAAEAQAQTGDFLQARDLIQEILRTGVKQAEYFAFASELEQRLQNVDRAKFYAGQVKKVKPQFELDSFHLVSEGPRVTAR